MNNKRPVNLDLGTMKFPPMAIASILHRISGIVIFLLLPFMLYLLEQTLHSAASFEKTLQLLTNPLAKIVVWGFLTAVFYHLFAGVRHILMDFGFGEELESGQRSSVTVIALGVIAAIALGVWVW